MQKKIKRTNRKAMLVRQMWDVASRMQWANLTLLIVISAELMIIGAWAGSGFAPDYIAIGALTPIATMIAIIGLTELLIAIAPNGKVQERIIKNTQIFWEKGAREDREL